MALFARPFTLHRCAACKPPAPIRACSARDMSWQPRLSPEMRFKSAMEQYYSARSTRYDQEGDFHPRMVELMVDLADLRPGHRCLDLCTGTGQVAVRTRHRIGSTGSVVAIDFSRAMLDVAAQNLSFPNVNLWQNDAEDLPSSLGLFDRITCASGLVLLRDIPKALQTWRDLLVSDGLMVLDGPSDDAFIHGALVARAASALGLCWPIDQVLGNKQKAVALLEAAGLELVSFTQQAHGSTITLPKLQKSWETITPFVNSITPPSLRDALRNVYMQKAADYMSDCEEVWSNNTMNFVVAKRARTSIKTHV